VSKEFEKLNYGILGVDEMSTEEKLAKYTGDVDWEYIREHFQAGKVIYVDPTLDLKEVGEAFIQDNKEAVQAWKKKADIVIPSHHHAQWWEYDKTCFMTAIVHPFVLIQPMPKA
jgi:hypothetical protein